MVDTGDSYDVVILGGGPGGYAAALYAHNFGLSVALVEKDLVGGTCLHRGCIPAKSWLHAAEVFTEVREAEMFGVETSDPHFNWATGLDRKNQVVGQLHKGLEGLLKTRKVDIVEGVGRINGPNAVEVVGAGGLGMVQGRNLIIATGSVPLSIPGFDFGDRIVSSDEALSWSQRPERAAIIGAGAVGCEFASLLADLGSEVHLFELMDQVLPGMDPDAAKVLDRALRRRGVQVTTGVAVEPAVVGEESVTVTAGDVAAEVDAVLVAVGRAPVTDDIGLDTVSVETEGGYVLVDAATMMTSEAGVYAVGDIVAGTPQLAHAGFAEGMAAITHIATGVSAPIDYRAIPLIVYSRPEVAAVGLTAEAARDEGYEVDEASHGFGGVARAVIQGKAQGTVKVVVQKDGPILGASIAGPAAGELIHELMYSVAWEALPAEAAAFVHAHPTMAEAVGETLLAASGKGLH